ncbi:MAG TPA: 6-carboxytetrahydropterin synthase [Acidobacteriota bacterium]|nr:6-carboxytetrahydropterin synthase [Acidobacteriota bacterium]
MYAVVKKIRFCYGHRLMDYQGNCARLHGHNAVAEIRVSAPLLNRTGMVVDFGEIAAGLENFIQTRLDHQMLLRRDDPAAQALTEAGEPIVLLDENPTAECIARLIFEEAARSGLAVESVRLWETDDSWAEYRTAAPPAEESR